MTTIGQLLRRALVGIAVPSALVLPGCGTTAADLPLPGGGAEGETYELTAVFTDALNLPAKAHVKLDGVRVGAVTEIVADDYRARVSFEVTDDIELPRGTGAELRQATPLGDIFLALQVPSEVDVDEPRLQDGDTISRKLTSAAVSVEDLLGSMSLLLNGGGLAQMGTIVRESNNALTGRGETVQHLLREMGKSVATLNSRTAEIDEILNSSHELSELAARRQATIDAALEDFTPALRALNRQEKEIHRTLEVIRSASRTGDRLIRESAPDALTLLPALDPILQGFADLDGVLAPTLELMVTFADLLAGATEGESLAGTAVIDFRGGSETSFNGLPGSDTGAAAFETFLAELFAAAEGAS